MSPISGLKVTLKSYWGATETKPLYDVRITRSIYPCDTNWYVSGTYYAEGISGPCRMQHTWAVCKTMEDALQAIVKAKGEL